MIGFIEDDPNSGEEPCQLQRAVKPVTPAGPPWAIQDLEPEWVQSTPPFTLD